MRTQLNALATFMVVAGVSATGCMASAETDEASLEDEPTGSVSSEIGTCPSTTSEAKLQQARASVVLTYIIGGPTIQNPATGPWVSSCSSLYSLAGLWRSAFAKGKKTTYEKYTFKAATALSATTVCGLSTSPVEFTVWTDPTDFFPQQGLISEMKNCWGATIEPFANVVGSSYHCETAVPCQYSSSKFQMDPETAQYTASLSTTNGASASATLLSTGKATTGYRLPCSTCTPYYKSTVPVGAPCSYGTTTVTKGTKTNYEAVQPTNMTGYRRCANGTLL